MPGLFSAFTPSHIPALFIAFTQTFGGIWPILSTRFTAPAMREFGLPNRIADSREAQAVFVTGAGRTTVIGVIMYMLYFDGRYEDLDKVLVILGGIVGMVDGYVCVREGVGRQAVKRTGAGLAIALWGWFGLTAGLGEAL